MRRSMQMSAGQLKVGCKLIDYNEKTISTYALNILKKDLFKK
jgi:hypothetical protein